MVQAGRELMESSVSSRAACVSDTGITDPIVTSQVFDSTGLSPYATIDVT